MKSQLMFGLSALILILEAGHAASTELNFGYTGARQFFTVPFTGVYDITAAGAQGGNADGNAGGAGVLLGGNFTLTAGDLLEVDVGGQGGFGYFGGSAGTTASGHVIPSFHYGAGGGGASWVRANRFDLLLTAGGGGGAGAFLPFETPIPDIYGYGFRPDSPGRGGFGYFAYEGNGFGGAAGSNYTGSFGGGGGGTGFYTQGGSPAHGGGQGGGVDGDILVGGLSTGMLGGVGGFGGGGGGDAYGAGGGGGGYTGGAGGSLIIGSYISGYRSFFGSFSEAQYAHENTGLGGEGGSSYFSGDKILTPYINPGNSSGNGYIQIAYADNQINTGGGGFSGPPQPPAVPEPATWVMMLIGVGLVGGMTRRQAQRTAAIA